MRLLKLISGSIAGLVVSACATLPNPDLDPDAIVTFSSDAQIESYIRAQDREQKRIRERRLAAGPDNDDVIIVTGTRAAEVSITNIQEEGVDEGGLVKATTDHLIVLRRGRLHVIKHADDTLAPVSSIDAFPPDDPDPDDTWYDEMLLHGGMVIVIGYSYGEDGTEISRFELSDDGVLSYRDTHYLTSFDYYSSSNYASRLAGGKLMTYTPSEFDSDWREQAPVLERRNPDGSRVRINSTIEPSSIGLSASMIEDIAPGARMIHGITQCDVLAPALTCSTRGVLGTWSSEYYFSRNAAYILTGSGHNNRFGSNEKDHHEVLYRIPLDQTQSMQALGVQGAPLDQFSFLEDAETDSLFVLTKGDFVFEDSGSFGLMMWESEFAFGEAALLRIPLEEMGNGARELPQSLYRPLPSVDGRIRNRFVGRHLIYGGGYYDREGDTPLLYVTPLDEGWVQRIELPHGISRLDTLGLDGIAVGQDRSDSLGFSAIEFAEDRLGARLGATYKLPEADEGENRSHAFFYRPDPFDPESGDGLMALPVDKELDGYDFEYLGSSTSMLFLERRERTLKAVGELGTYPDAATIAAAEEMEKLEDEGDCKASCVDWYGNSRPIFIGERIFALMGDQIVEGEMEEGQMRERRRINFAR